jgi:signal transduction histidine kinase/ActR/RegA family two-component response regulator
LISWPISLLICFALGVLVVWEEASAVKNIESERLEVLLPIIKNSIFGEIYIGEERSITAVKKALSEKYRLHEINIQRENYCSHLMETHKNLFDLSWLFTCNSDKLSESDPRYVSIVSKVPLDQIIGSVLRILLFISPLIFISLMLPVYVRNVLSKSVATPLRELAADPAGWKESSQFIAADEIAILSEQIKLHLYEKDRDRQKVENLRVSAAIGQTTQALAHDVRKPFSMFNMIIEMVDATDDPQEAKELLKEALPEVKKAITSVNGMIQDIMEVGSESKPTCEPTNPETLIESALNEIFRVYPNSDVRISFDLKHTHKVRVDTLKINRVFSNIVGNALQAMSYQGDIWFKTRETENSEWIEFSLGNAGSYIPAQTLPHLFEAFFTSQKKGGTGLGLAIAQKIVRAHGGNIWCESTKDSVFPKGKVEFIFTLPIDESLVDLRTFFLPQSSKAITESLEKFRAQGTKQGPQTDHLEIQLERTLIQKLNEHKDPVALLIIDDEAVYRNALTNLITRNEDLAKKISIYTAQDANEALSLAVSMRPCLVILDVDLGQGSASGIEVVKVMRENAFSGRVCIHSNRFLVEDYKIAIAAGANTVLPKPMSRTHFLKVILEALEQSISYQNS